MGLMTLCHTFNDNAYIELTGGNVKFWEGEGLPVYEGGLDGFAACYPAHMQTMIEAKLVKRLPDDDPAPM